MKKKIIFIVLITILLSGCSYKEINKLAIVNALGIDFENNNYIISAQVMDLKKTSDNSNEESSILYKGEGKTIVEALNNISLEYPYTLYLGHLELMIIGEGVINSEKIEYLFDYFLRDPNTRTDCLLLMSLNNKAEDIVNPKTENKESNFPSKDLISTIENSVDSNGFVIKQTLDDFIINYYKENIDIVSTNIEIIENDNKKETKLDSLLVFNKNKYMTSLDKNNSLIYNTIMNNYKNANFSIEDINISFITNSNIETKIKDNKITFIININLEGTVNEVHKDISFNEDKYFYELESLSKKEITKEVEDFILFCKNNNIDPLGFKNELYKHNYKLYKKYKDNNIYDISSIEINTNISIYKYGNISSSKEA